MLGNQINLKVPSNFGMKIFQYQIEVEDLDDPNRQYIFPCGQWLSSEREDTKTWCELYPITKRMALMNAKKMEKMNKTKQKGRFFLRFSHFHWLCMGKAYVVLTNRTASLMIL